MSKAKGTKLRWICKRSYSICGRILISVLMELLCCVSGHYPSTLTPHPSPPHCTLKPDPKEIITCWKVKLVIFLSSNQNAFVRSILSLVCCFYFFFVVICGQIFCICDEAEFPNTVEWQKILTEILCDKILFWKTRRKGSNKFKIGNRLLI